MSRIIDFHSHILPGIDDGSPDVATSLSMLRAARAQGVETQVLTPHFYRWREDISSFLARRDKSFDQLEAALPAEAPRLLVGSETAFFPHMSREDLSPLCVGSTRVLLLEMPFSSWEDDVLDEVAALSLDKGYEVVLAHVERFLGFSGNGERLEKLAELPIHMQSNAEVFLSFRTRRRALQMVKSGMVTILGSDAHNLTTRCPNLGPARDQIEKRLGRELLAGLDAASADLLREAVEV